MSPKLKEGKTSRPSSYLFVKAFIGSDGKKKYFFKSVTVDQNGMEVSISNHIDSAKRLRNSLKNGKLLYRFYGGAQTEQVPREPVSVTTPQTNPAEVSVGKDNTISENARPGKSKTPQLNNNTDPP